MATIVTAINLTMMVMRMSRGGRDVVVVGRAVAVEVAEVVVEVAEVEVVALALVVPRQSR
jgi:hypothetical protein